MENKITKLAESQRLQFNHSKNLLDVVCIKIHKSNEEVFGVSFILTCDLQCIYVDSIVAQNDHEIIDILEKFCNESVKQVNETYNRHMNFVMYDGEYNLSEVSTVNEAQCFKLQCLSVMINHLRKVNFQIDCVEATQLMLEYYKILDSLENKWRSPKYSLDYEVEDIFQLILTNNAIVNVFVENTIYKFTNGAALAANFLNYKLYGNKFMKDYNLSRCMSQFLETVLPNDAFDALAQYKASSGEFLHFKNVR